MILSYKLCIIILLEPVKVDIKRTQAKNKTVRKYNKVHFTFVHFISFHYMAVG